jgi:hypothetical protein
MATILQHKKSKEKFILLGAGYGRSHGNYNETDEEKEKRPGVSVNFGTPYKTVEQTYLCVAKNDRSIWWVKDDEVEVYKIDGMSPEQALNS